MKSLIIKKAQYDAYNSRDPNYNITLQRIIALSYAITKEEHINIKKFLRHLKWGDKAVGWEAMEPFGKGVVLPR